MDYQQIYNRIEYLRLAIAYSRWHGEKIMNIEQGIVCNQEVANWFGVICGRLEHPEFTIPDHLEFKVTRIHKMIQIENWTKPRNYHEYK